MLRRDAGAAAHSSLLVEALYAGAVLKWARAGLVSGERGTWYLA